MSRALFVVGVLFVVGFASSANVVTLTEENFDEVIKSNDFVLVEFFAPWCGHCKSLAPEYEKAATTLQGNDPKIVLAAVDATEARSLGDRFGVKGFPTLKFFRGGNPTDYDGPRQEAGIVNWLKKKTGPPAKTLASVDEAKAFKDENDVAVVGVFGEENAEEKAAFEKAALANDDTPFGLVNDAAVAESLSASTPSVVVFQNFDDGRADYTGDLTDSDAIAEFVAGNSLPLIIPFSDEKSRQIFGAEIKVHVLIFSDDSDEAAHSAILAEAKSVAVAFRGQALFVTINKEHDRIMEFFGLSDSDLPTVRLVTMGGQMRKYQYTEDAITTAGLTTFLESFFAGTLQASLKSEEVPETQAGPVTVVVGKSFDDIVLDTTKDVLVEFYAPWCGHCKRLVPVYDKLAERFAGVDSVVIAKMDATANEHAAVDVQGFPTIKLWRADNKKEPMDFDGSRDEEGFVDFLKENAAIKFDLDAPAAAAAGGDESSKDEL